MSITLTGRQLCPEAEILIQEDVALYHTMGFSVLAWGLFTPEIMQETCTMGVDGMTVNSPDLLTEYLKKL